MDAINLMCLNINFCVYFVLFFFVFLLLIFIGWLSNIFNNIKIL